MKIFVSHKYTGENLSQLQAVLGRLTASLRSLGHEVFCSIEHIEFFSQKSAEENYTHCLKLLEKHDVLLAFAHSPNPSKGMHLEIDAARKHMPILLAIQHELDHNDLRQKAHKVIDFLHMEHLCQTIPHILPELPKMPLPSKVST